MGTVFQVPWTRIGDAGVPNRPGCGTWSDEGIAELHEHGIHLRRHGALRRLA